MHVLTILLISNFYGITLHALQETKYACENSKRIESVKQDLAKQLIEALESDNTEQALALIQKSDTDINYLYLGFTPLMHCINYAGFVGNYNYRYIGLIQTLLAKENLDINTTISWDEQKFNALNLAAEWHNIAVMQLLINAGASVSTGGYFLDPQKFPRTTACSDIIKTKKETIRLIARTAANEINTINKTNIGSAIENIIFDYLL